MLVSDAERERALTQLSDRHVEGLLGDETFEQRVEAVLRAKRRVQLELLLSDLPDRRSGWRDALTTLLRASSTPPDDEVTDVSLPGWADLPIILGRSRACDVHVADGSVSARHLEVRALIERDRWLVIDLGSLNGTWMFERRIGRTVVQPGDVLLLGAAAVRFMAP